MTNGLYCSLILYKIVQYELRIHSAKLKMTIVVHRAIPGKEERGTAKKTIKESK